MYLNFDALLLTDVFGNFTKICSKIYHLDHAKFLSVTALAWQAALIKTRVKLELITDIDMQLIVEKGIRGGIWHAIYQLDKGNNKYMNYYDENKESLYLKHWDVNNLYGWAMSQKLPVNKFEWIKDNSQFNEDFKKTLIKKVMKDIFLKLMFNTLRNYMNFVITYHFF